MGANRGRWHCSSLLYPPVKSFLTCPPERLQGPGFLHPALRGMARNVFGEGVLEELCLVEYTHREVIAIGTDMGLQEVWA